MEGNPPALVDDIPCQTTLDPKSAYAGAETILKGEDLSSGPNIGGKIPRHPREARRWSWLITLLKIGLSALAFGAVAFSVDLSAAWEHVANQSKAYIGISALILSLQLLLGGLRWHAILARLGANPSLRDFGTALLHLCFLQRISLGSGRRRRPASMANLPARSSAPKPRSIRSSLIASRHSRELQFWCWRPRRYFYRGSEIRFRCMFHLVSPARTAGITVVANLRRLPAAWLGTTFMRFLQSLGGIGTTDFPRSQGGVSGAQLCRARPNRARRRNFRDGGKSRHKGQPARLYRLDAACGTAGKPADFGGRVGVRETAVVLLVWVHRGPIKRRTGSFAATGPACAAGRPPRGILWLLLQLKERAPKRGRDMHWPRHQKR